jgi:hypothetical protein
MKRKREQSSFDSYELFESAVINNDREAIDYYARTNTSVAESIIKHLPTNRAVKCLQRAFLAGADPEYRDEVGRTLFEIAQIFNPDLSAYLITQGCS